jgi:hypothetical protein
LRVVVGVVAQEKVTVSPLKERMRRLEMAILWV